MTAIYKREMRSYFTTPMGYVFIAFFLALNSLIFSIMTLLEGQNSDVGMYFMLILFVLMILIPILTMKSFSEERKSRTEQLLLTAPISITGMVMAKFFAAFTMFAGTYLFGSIINFSLLFAYGEPNAATLAGSTLGVILVGAAFIAVGIFVSSLTENQLVAMAGTIGILFFILILGVFNSFIDSYFLRTVLNWISIYSRYTNLSYGIIDPAALLYYFSICFVFIFLTVRIFEKRRWS